MVIFYRFGSHITSPFIDTSLIELQNENALNLLNKLSGGSISRLSIFSLGIIPYITAVIIVHMMSLFLPFYKNIKKEGGHGQLKLNKHIIYLTLLFSIFQATTLIKFFATNAFLLNNSFIDLFMVGFSMVVGTMILVYIGNLSTKHGIGNGLTLLIFSNIVVILSEVLKEFYVKAETGEIGGLFVLLAILFFFALIFLISTVENSYRNLKVINSSDYNKRISYPFKVNLSGIMPIIMTYIIFSFMSYVSPYFGFLENFLNLYFQRGSLIFNILLGLLTFAFGYVYVFAIHSPRKLSEQFKNNNIIIPGIRPGEQTEKIIKNIIVHISFIGILYLIIISIFVDYFSISYSIGPSLTGTSFLIMVLFSIEWKNELKLYIRDNQYKNINKKLKEITNE